MSHNLRYAFRLFFTLTWTTFKMRYYGGILGYIWSLLRLLALFGVLYVFLPAFIVPTRGVRFTFPARSLPCSSLGWDSIPS